MISKSPGSTRYFISTSQNASDSGVISKRTVAVWPGSRSIRRNPFNSFTGRVTELTRSRMYICTTSLPARVPVLVTSARASTFPSAAIRLLESRTLPTLKVV